MSYRITRTSREPHAALEIQMNVGSAGLIVATAATDAGPSFSAIVDDETGRHFREDEGLARHFTVEPLTPAPASGRTSKRFGDD